MSDHHTVMCNSCSNETGIPTVGSNEQVEWFHLSPRRLPGIGLDGQYFEPTHPTSVEDKDFCSLECLAHYVQRLRLEQEAERAKSKFVPWGAEGTLKRYARTYAKPG